MLFSLKLRVITGCKKYNWIKIELNRALVRKKQLWLSKPIIFKLMRLIMNLSDPLLCMVALPRRKRPYNTPTQKQKLRNSRLWKTPQSLVNRVTKFAKWTNYLSHSRRCNNFSILLEKQLFLWVPIHSNKHPSHLATTCIVVIRLSKYWQLNVQKRNQLTRDKLTSSFSLCFLYCHFYVFIHWKIMLGITFPVRSPIALREIRVWNSLEGAVL